MDITERSTLVDTLTAGAETIGVTLSTTQIGQCLDYAELLLEYNTHTNLTRITEPGDIALKHFVDSLTILVAAPSIRVGARLADVGTGAGFPGVVLKIARPDLKVTLIDSLAKRLTFLQSVIDKLGLSDMELVHLRAEDAGRDTRYRDKFDVVTARAVAALPTLLEWCGPLVSDRGTFVAMKSPSVDSEIESGNAAAKSLGLVLLQDHSLDLPGNGETADLNARRLITYRKIRTTPALYPRTPAQIKHKPLS